ncbi:MAG: ABC transporter permease subunit [Candidatus Dormibacteria bacterium]|jgi:ABC-type transport system involved in multi-copper enzyme maturation permease subunit
MTAGSAPTPALASLHWARPRFGGAVRGELLKLRRQRPTLVMTTLGVLFLAVVMLVYATNPTLQAQLVHHPLSGFYGILSPLQLFFTMGAGIAILLTASRLLGMEYDLGTIRVLLGRGTGRWQMLFAKLVAVAIYALVLLVGFTLLAAVGTLVVVQHQTGSVGLLEQLPGVAWGNLGLALLACAISEFSCILLALAMASLLRSVTGGMLLAVLFFPVDNGLAVALPQMQHVTGAAGWAEATAFLYGPSLNRLPGLLQLHRPQLYAGLATPAVHTSLPETLAVVGAWWLLLLALSALSLSRHDVLS